MSASRFRYDTSGQWLKGNVHLHTTHSDGGRTPEQAAVMYAAAGHDFLVCTDHGIASNVGGEQAGQPLIWLDGIELDGTDDRGAFYHVIALGRFRDLSPDMELTDAMAAVRDQNGLLFLAHPHWCGNTMDDALRHRFDGVEAYNHVCRWLNGKSDSFAHWDRMLEERPNTLGLAVDDAHLKPQHPGWNGGWIVVNVQQRTSAAIYDAIRHGNFYSSCGPEFHDIELRRGHVAVRTSPVSFIRLVGPRTHGARIGSFQGETYTEAEFAIPDEWATVRVEIEDRYCRRAWTNPLFIQPTPLLPQDR